MISQEQKKFLENMFFAASWSAASGHNRVWGGEYRGKGNPIAHKRAEFRSRLQDKAESLLDQYKDKTPSEEQHIANIQALKTFSKEKGNELNIGTVQKLLNMLCKYYWCVGWIQEPPHLPIDSIMRKRLPPEILMHTTKWTHLDSIDEYKVMIAAFKEKSKAEGFNSLAQWELKTWNAVSKTVTENL